MTSELVTIESPQAVTPMRLLEIATQQGADIDKLGQLMALNERWESNEARKAFVVALNAFKASPPRVSKNKQVAHNGKYMYSHATLDNVSGIIGEALAKVGISHRWETEQLDGGLIRVTCILTHERGHSERVPLQASPDTSGSKNSIQAIGSTVTYLQRYTLLAATGMAVQDQDDDGAGGVKEMSATMRAGFLDRIDCIETISESDDLWKQIAKSCTETGDIAAYEVLKSAMAKARKALTQTTKGTAP